MPTTHQPTHPERSGVPRTLARFLSRGICAAVTLALLVAAQAATAQLMINKGAVIVTKPSSYTQVNGAYQNQTGSIDDSGTVTITTDFTNNVAATSSNAGLYNIGGNFTNDGTFNRKTGTVDLYGSTNQNVGGAVITTFYNLKFTGGGSKTLTQKEIVDSNCYFTNGVCYTTQPYVLNFDVQGQWINNSGMPVAPCASYVSGPCEKDMNSTARWWFPVGKGNRANTAAITPQTTTATTYRTEYFNFKYVNTTSIQSPLLAVSNVQYWHGDIVTGGTNAIIRLYWIPGDYASSWMQSISGLVVARWDTLAPNPPGPTPAWVTAGVSAVDPAATFNSGWIESAVVTAAKYGTYVINRPFTIASITADNSLPVEMGPFTAHQQDNHVVLDWQTYAEIQNFGFEIERQKLADSGLIPESNAILIKSFASDPNLLAKSPWGAQYETIDDQGLTTGRYKYDLYQVDQNAVRLHVASRVVAFNELDSPRSVQLAVYPNPIVEHATVDFALPQAGFVSIAIYDITGRLVQQVAQAEFDAGAHSIPFDVTTLATGQYTMHLSNGVNVIARNFIVTR